MAYYKKLDESIYPAGYADLKDSFYDGSGVYGQLNRKIPYNWSRFCCSINPEGGLAKNPRVRRQFFERAPNPNPHNI